MSESPRYIRAESLEHALVALAEHGDDATLLAGGQSLVPMLNTGLLSPGVIVDIDRLSSLDAIELEDGALRVGALVRHRDVIGSALIRERCPLLVEAARLIGHPQIRNRGTVGGSLAHADPAAEYPAVMLALGATLRARSARGAREIAVEDFFITFLTTALAADEILIDVLIPAHPDRVGWSFQELTIREGDFAIVAACALLSLDAAGHCAAARIALASVDAVPVRASQAEATLLGSGLDDGDIEHAAQVASASVQPVDDVRASGAYRQRMVAVFVRRALRSARQRAQVSASGW